MLRAASCNLRKCVARPSNASRRAQRWLRFASRRAVGSETDRPTDRAPAIERGTILLLPPKDDESQHDRSADRRRGAPPADPGPGITEFQRISVLIHHLCPVASDWLVTSTAGTECCLR